jgi:hypothetical protein
MRKSAWPCIYGAHPVIRALARDWALNLTRFHGVFAPGAQLRPFLAPQAAGAEEASVALEAAASKEPLKERTPQVDQAELLRKMFDLDVFACVS